MKTKKLFYSLLFLLICFSSSAQALWNSPQRYVQMVFGPYKIARTTNLAYTSNSVDLNGSTKTFTCNITQPQQAFDPIPNRPVIVLVPGGGFEGIGDDLYLYYEEYFARMGYVVLKINRYRLYQSSEYSQRSVIDATKQDKYGKYSSFPGLAVYAAMQDVNAAIKYLVSRQNDFHIDPNKIFLFGESAGAITIQALALTKVNLPTNEMADLYSLQGYGDINYTTMPAYKGLSYTVVGALPIAGGLINDALLKADDRIPMWMEQNMNDQVAIIGLPKYYATYPDPNSRSSVTYNVVINRIKNINIQGGNYPCSYFIATSASNMFDYPANNHCMNPSNIHWQNIIRPMIGTFCKRILNGNTSCDPSYYNGTYYYNFFSTSLASARIGDDLDIESTEEVALSVYPNPTNSLVTIKGLNRDNTITLKAYDVLGHEVLTKEVAAGTSNEDYILSLQGLSAGCYYLHVPNQNSNAVIKIIKVD